MKGFINKNNFKVGDKIRLKDNHLAMIWEITNISNTMQGGLYLVTARGIKHSSFTKYPDMFEKINTNQSQHPYTTLFK